MAVASNVLDVEKSWQEELLDALAEQGVRYLPYVPDEVLNTVLDEAGKRDEFELIPLTREEEGVGILSGVHLGGHRGALLMQASGLGNCLNAIGSLSIAQRIPLLMIASERGGLGEKVLTQIPFGYAVPRVLEATGIQCHQLTDVGQVRHAVRGAVETAYISRVSVCLYLRSFLTKG